MYARVTHLRMKPSTIDEAMARLREEVSPELEQDPGFKVAYVLGDRETGEAMAISIWEDADSERASSPKVAQRFGKLNEFYSGPPQKSTSFEVLTTATPATAPTA